MQVLSHIRNTDIKVIEFCNLNMCNQDMIASRHLPLVKSPFYLLVTLRPTVELFILTCKNFDYDTKGFLIPNISMQVNFMTLQTQLNLLLATWAREQTRYSPTKLIEKFRNTTDSMVSEPGYTMIELQFLPVHRPVKGADTGWRGYLKPPRSHRNQRFSFL